MTIKYMVYASIRSSNTTEVDVDTIIETAEYKNALDAISGVILIKSNYFFQYFEGEPEDVDKLYDNLIKDPRHKDIKLLHTGYIDDRIFPGWAMYPIQSITDHQVYETKIKSCPDRKLRDILITYCINERPIQLLY